MKLLALQDLSMFTVEEIIEHLINEYSGTASGHDYGQVTEETKASAKELLKDIEPLIAYESVGDYGCDSSSFFLLKNVKTGVLYEVHGSHCSCFGFEGQLQLEETSVDALKKRCEGDKNVFYTGGYDENGGENYVAVKKYIQSL